MAPLVETYSGEMTRIAARVAVICDKIRDAAEETETMSARRVAAISAMILDVAAEEATTSSSRSRKKRRLIGSARSYEDTCTLREDGLGVVSKARHRATGQTVVLKAPHHRYGSLDMLLREACFMSACRGELNAVALLGIARAPGTSDYSIVSEYVGPSLHHVLRDRIDRVGSPFTEAEVRGIMRQLLSGAAAMHAHRIIHRDIKPEHIVVRSGDDSAAALVVKIGDYGVAMLSGEQNGERGGVFRFAGTGSYMAPEMMLLKPDYDTRVDTWSLGCVMAELLTGETLFEMASLYDTVTDQLYKIFDLLGVPGKKAYREFKSPYSCYTDEVELWRREQQKRARHGSRLREMFPEKTLSKEGFEVLNGLLTCSPSKRLDAAAALRLPWFADTNDHPPAPAPAPAPAAVVSKSSGAACSIWTLASCSWQMAIACFRRVLRSVYKFQQ